MGGLLWELLIQILNILNNIPLIDCPAFYFDVVTTGRVGYKAIRVSALGNFALCRQEQLLKPFSVVRAPNSRMAPSPFSDQPRNFVVADLLNERPTNTVLDAGVHGTRIPRGFPKSQPQLLGRGRGSFEAMDLGLGCRNDYYLTIPASG